MKIIRKRPQTQCQCKTKSFSISERRPVVILIVPQTFAGDSDSLSSDLANDSLHHNLIRRNVQRLHLHFDLVGYRLCHGFGSCMIILLILQIPQYHFLNAWLYFQWVESVLHYYSLVQVTFRTHGVLVWRYSRSLVCGQSPYCFLLF